MKSNLLNQVRGLFSRDRTRLLVVDDEEALRDLFFQFFEGHGYHVTLAASIEEAQGFLKTEAFELVLHDVMLEDGNGIDSLIQIKSNHPALPVIMLTSLGYDQECFNDAVKHGASAYVSKLLPLDQILMEIHRVLKWSKKNDE